MHHVHYRLGSCYPSSGGDPLLVKSNSAVVSPYEDVLLITHIILVFFYHFFQLTRLLSGFAIESSAVIF